MDSDRELMLEDARSISQGLWRIAQLAQDAAESLDERIEDEDLDGMEEAVEVREAMERAASTLYLIILLFGSCSANTTAYAKLGFKTSRTSG